MSHQYYSPATTRLQRSELAVPGSSPKMFEKALNSNADYIFLDLEDAVSPNDKIIDIPEIKDIDRWISREMKIVLDNLFNPTSSFDFAKPPIYGKCRD